MNNKFTVIVNQYEELVGKLQGKYGIAKEEARHRMLDSGGRQ
jgi:uncharacterized protein YjbJ (UPF0337 family)